MLNVKMLNLVWQVDGTEFNSKILIIQVVFG